MASLSIPVAELLSKYHGKNLFLNGLVNINDRVAEVLSEFPGILWLNGLTYLSDSSALSLSKFKGNGLYLKGLTNISNTAAQLLVVRKDKIAISYKIIHKYS